MNPASVGVVPIVFGGSCTAFGRPVVPEVNNRLGITRCPGSNSIGSIPPTNRRVSMRGGRFVRLDDHELITECRRYYDMAGIMQQLGLM